MEEEKLLPAAEGIAVVEEQATRKGNPNCLNCNTVLTDAYCPHCGQKDIPRRQTLLELLQNFISSFWSYESKFFLTGQYLLFRPGFLAREYTLGHRERYFHPARMYVFISFVYFLLLTSLPGTDANEDPDTDKTELSDDEYGAIFALDDSVEYKTFSQYDSVQKALPESERDSWLLQLAIKREFEIRKKYGGYGEEFQKAVQNSFLANFSKVFFWLLPIFAVILKLLYIRRDFYYSEHLVFSIYYYNFFYLAGSLYMLSDQVSWLGWLSAVILIWIFLYLLLGMKAMYRQGWKKTIVKYAAFATFFSIFLVLGVLANLALTLMYL